MSNRTSAPQWARSIVAAMVALPLAAAAGPQDVANAMQVLDDVSKVTAGMAQLHLTLNAPTPVPGSGGAFVSPYRCDGTPAEWTNKAMSAAAGSAVAGAATDKATDALGSKIPGASLFGGFFKKKAKDTAAQEGAVAGAGGWDFIKSSSDLSFNSLDDLAVYMQAKHGTDTDFAQRVAAAFALYPDLQAKYKPAIETAVKSASASPAPAAAPSTATTAPAAPACK